MLQTILQKSPHQQNDETEMVGFFDTAIVSSKKPQSSIPKCGACGLLNHCQSPKIPVFGKGRQGILVVGESPGEQDDYDNRPFRGSAGKILRDALAKCGVDLDTDCWATNALICKTEGNTAPTDDQVDWCRPNLKSTIDLLKPRMIIPLGWAAIRSVLGPYYRESTGTVAQWVGWKIPLQALNAWVTPTYAPTYVSKMKDDRSGPLAKLWFDRHIAEALELPGTPYKVVPDYRKEVKVILDPTDAARWIRDKVRCGGPTSFDYETNCLKPDREDAAIITVGFCWKGVETMACPMVGEVRQATKEFVESSLPKIGANNKFEDRWSRCYLGTDRVQNWVWDCMLSAHHLDNRKGITSVKFQAFIRCGQTPWDEAIAPFFEAKDEVSLNRIRECDLRKLLVYNGLDAILEWKIAANQRAEMKFQNL
jgi:uracil-DNA glycosylase family 4